eukprot:TRINITY_DN18308_c0_g1_i1.p2 TRINITY_DN18308_c0_g1~~TRINITY_DN18308_c0_g1_i1.p2  ORF type:complete len:119 (-),score=7.51 TRINITY_DN18308_c0_g1_i1:31-336(-)
MCIRDSFFACVFHRSAVPVSYAADAVLTIKCFARKNNTTLHWRRLYLVRSTPMEREVLNKFIIQYPMSLAFAIDSVLTSKYQKKITESFTFTHLTLSLIHI